MPTPKDRTSYAVRIETVEDHMRRADEDYAVEAWNLERDDTPEQRAKVQALEAEMAGYRTEIARLKAAQAGAGKQASQQDLVAKERAEAALLAEIADLEASISAGLTEVLTSLAGVGPLYSKVVGQLAQRHRLVNACARSRLGSANVIHRHSGALQSQSCTGEIASAVVAAVIESGVGTVGPSTLPWVAVSAPMTRSTSEQALDRLRKRFAAAHELLAGAMEPVTEEAAA